VFEIGEGVMHPVHGAGLIRDISCESLSGDPVDYYVIDMLGHKMKLLVPVEKAEEIGLRRPAGAEDVKELLEVVSGPAESLPTDFRERISLLRSALSGGFWFGRRRRFVIWVGVAGSNGYQVGVVVRSSYSGTNWPERSHWRWGWALKSRWCFWRRE
jgi:hypothetical protein